MSVWRRRGGGAADVVGKRLGTICKSTKRDYEDIAGNVVEKGGGVGVPG